MKIRAGILFLLSALLTAQTTLRQAGDQRALLMGAAADADEFGQPNRLLEPAYASTLSTQYSMLEPENAMKWQIIRPSQSVFDFEPGDKLVAFAQANQMQIRGHNLCWYSSNPAWLTSFAATATTGAMSTLLQTHINTVMNHYKGQVFAWDVVNEAFNDGSSGTLRDSIWYDQPGIGLSGTGYIEQAFRWAHAADPNALLFYNDYNIEVPGAKFTGVYNMVKDFVSRGVPIHGIGIQMHIDTTGYPDSAGFAQNIQQLTALGLQVHITEMDVRIPVDSNGVASAANLQLQAQTYQRILTVCLQNPGCTAFQTWGFTDKYSWVPGTFPGQGAALPFDANYQPKPAFNSLINALQTVPPVLTSSYLVDSASYQGGAVAPGELVALFQANFGPASIAAAQLDSNGRVSSNLSGAQILFDSVAAPMVFAEAGVASAIVPFGVSGKSQTSVQYSYNGVASAAFTIPVVDVKPAIFSADSTGKGPGRIFNQDYSPNTASNPALAGSTVIVYATGAGTIVGGAIDGGFAPSAGTLTHSFTAAIGGTPATISYVGPAPLEVNGVIIANIVVPQGLPSGPAQITLTSGTSSSQTGVTVFVK